MTIQGVSPTGGLYATPISSSPSGFSSQGLLRRGLLIGVLPVKGALTCDEYAEVPTIGAYAEVDWN